MEHLNTAGVAGGAAGEEKEFNLYRDIKFRTDGEIYLGVVGPVRTGKSTFIKRFMDLLVIPYMENEHERLRAQDEMPQSGRSPRQNPNLSPRRRRTSVCRTVSI